MSCRNGPHPRVQTQNAITLQTPGNYKELSATAARPVSRQIEADPRALLSLAPGRHMSEPYASAPRLKPNCQERHIYYE